MSPDSFLALTTLKSLHMPFQGNELLWKIIGFTGMAAFFTRFFIQWLYSEKHAESRVPVIFWWQSLLGAMLMLLYSLRQRDEVYILGYLFTVIPYTRNLVLIYRRKRELARGFAVSPTR
jgi:lipid-A-disaccharide synthase-like uncharacterized protein